MARSRKDNMLVYFTEGKTIEEVQGITKVCMDTVRNHYRVFQKMLSGDRTQKHKECLAYIELGYSNTQISKDLACSQNTVAAYRSEYELLKEDNPDISFISELESTSSNNKQTKKNTPTTDTKQQEDTPTQEETMKNRAPKPISEQKLEQFNKLCQMKKEGKSQLQIAAVMGINQGRVSLLFQQYYNYKLANLHNDPQLVSEVIRLYTSEKKKAPQIAKELIVNMEIINACLEGNYGDQKTQEPTPSTNTTAQRIQVERLKRRAIQLYKSGLSQTDIAKALGKTSPTITSYLKDYKLQQKAALANGTSTLVEETPTTSQENVATVMDEQTTLYTTEQEVPQAMPHYVAFDAVQNTPQTPVETSQSTPLPVFNGQPTVQGMATTAPLTATTPAVRGNEIMSQTPVVDYQVVTYPAISAQPFAIKSKLRVRNIDGEIASYGLKGTTLTINAGTEEERLSDQQGQVIQIDINNIDDFIEELLEAKIYFKRG